MLIPLQQFLGNRKSPTRLQTNRHFETAPAVFWDNFEKQTQQELICSCDKQMEVETGSEWTRLNCSLTSTDGIVESESQETLI